jgi:hypothetical protein
MHPTKTRIVDATQALDLYNPTHQGIGTHSRVTALIVAYRVDIAQPDPEEQIKSVIPKLTSSPHVNNLQTEGAPTIARTPQNQKPFCAAYRYLARLTTFKELFEHNGILGLVECFECVEGTLPVVAVVAIQYCPLNRALLFDYS